MGNAETKEITIPCKLCAKEFATELALDVYEMLTEGEPTIFTGTCPACRKDDPFLALMDKALRRNK